MYVNLILTVSKATELFKGSPMFEFKITKPLSTNRKTHLIPLHFSREELCPWATLQAQAQRSRAMEAAVIHT